MNVIAALLAVSYMLLPPAVLLMAARAARRERSLKPLRPTASTLLTAAVIGFGLNYAYARAASAAWLWGQVLLTAWFLAAVLLVLKRFDAALRHVAARAAERLPARLGARGRRAAAGAARVGVLFAVGLPYVMAVAMVYRPKVRGPDPAEQLGLAFEDVTFGRDVTLAGWWVPAGSPPPPTGGREGERPERWGVRTVLLCHGLGASKSNALPMAEHLVRAGYNVLAVDLRAHGGSGGQVTTFGDAERRDVLAAVEWVRRARPDQSRQVLGVGASMGAAALVAAAADDSEAGRAIAAVAVYGTYDDLGDLSRTVCDSQFPRPLNWLGRYVAVPLAGLHAGTSLHAFAPADLLDRLPPRPILVIHGGADEIIAPDHGRRLFARAAEPKQLLWIDGGDHNSVLASPEAARAVRAFFDAAAR